MAVERFEDLIAWQKARVLAGRIYSLTQEGGFSRDFRLSSQIQSAAVSSMSNVAEGFEWNNPRQFDHYLRIAKSSCAEVRSLLYLALDVGYINQAVFEQTMNQADEVARVIAGLRATVNRNG